MEKRNFINKYRGRFLRCGGCVVHHTVPSTDYYSVQLRILRDALVGACQLLGKIYMRIYAMCVLQQVYEQR